jgi:cytoskeletal protein CcmA (bactofilin family)
MAVFSSTKRDAELPAALRSSGREPRLSILAAGIRVVGEIATEGVVKIEGEVEGSVRADGQVLVAKGGVVRGDIATRQAVIAGEVHGGIYADDRVELQASCLIDGDIETPRIVVEEGGQVNGHMRMTNPQVVGKPQEPPKKRGEKDKGAGGTGKAGPFELAGTPSSSNPKLALSGAREPKVGTRDT